jgi:GH25 family lysozyme M1 (1,4-beta-N-acetylmuramidase)
MHVRGTFKATETRQQQSSNCKEHTRHAGASHVCAAARHIQSVSCHVQPPTQGAQHIIDKMQQHVNSVLHMYT